MLNQTYVAVRRLLVFLLGVSVLLVGVVMLVTPGPAVVVIPAGLAILATEFVWARVLLARLKRSLTGLASRDRGAPAARDASRTPDGDAPDGSRARDGDPPDTSRARDGKGTGREGGGS